MSQVIQSLAQILTRVKGRSRDSPIAQSPIAGYLFGSVPPGSGAGSYKGAVVWKAISVMQLRASELRQFTVEMSVMGHLVLNTFFLERPLKEMGRAASLKIIVDIANVITLRV